MRVLNNRTSTFIVNNLSGLWVSITTIIYGLSLFNHSYAIQIIEPPYRYVLKFFCFFLPLLLIYFLVKNNRKLTGWLFIFISLLWWLIAWLYFIHPVYNSGGILAISNIGHSFILLFRGRFEDEDK